MGPARGPRPTSYRAEAVGLLSILRLLIRLAEFTAMRNPWNGVIGTDSKSVLDTLSGKQADGQRTALHEPVQIDSSGVVLDVLCPDWDILIEIQYAMQLLPGITLQFVKGHQDATVAFHQLPLLAQLNVEAHSLATKFQEDHGGNRPSQVRLLETMLPLFAPNQGEAHSNFISSSAISGHPRPGNRSIGKRMVAHSANSSPQSYTFPKCSMRSSRPHPN